MTRPIGRRFKDMLWACDDLVRARAWGHAHLLRKWRGTANEDAIAGKVLHVTNSFDLGGTQTQIKHLCTFGSTRYDHDAVEIFPELNFLYRQGVTIEADRYVRGGPWTRKLGRMVVNRNQRGSHLVQIYKLVRDFESERPSVVVGWGHENCVITFIAAAIVRVPHIVFCIRTLNPTAYEGLQNSSPRPLLRAHRRMLPFVSKVVTNSMLLQDDYARWVGTDPTSIAVCANGIDWPALALGDIAGTRARVRADHDIADEVVVIANVGRFRKEKGQSSIVEANRLLLAHQPARPFVWLLCGDGPTLAAVQAAAKSHGMTNVIFTGRTLAVVDVLSASDIFVMPSDFEGMPNALMEAMAAGLPCISTSRSGARDVAREGLEALYYEPGDTSRLAEHLLTLVNDSERRRALGACAEARIKEFGVPRFVNTFEGLLDKATARTG